ncbi:hypothetical protein ACWCPI_25765 [Streptomyces sp. NPDC001920]
MRLESARELKQEMEEFLAGEKLFQQREAVWWNQGAMDSDVPEPRTHGIALGISVGNHSYRLGVRLQNESPEAWQMADAIGEKSKGEVDIRPLGPVYAQCTCGPVRAGFPVGTINRASGTVGPFVVLRETGKMHALSNNHVLAASNKVALDEVISHPGGSAGGPHPQDRIGVLGWVEPLKALGTPNDMDAAACLLDEGLEVDVTVSGAQVTGPVDPTGPLEVTKIGRRTGSTTGRITLIDFGPLEVGGYGDMGKLVFRDQIEIRRDNGAPFSLPGDSGSLVFDSRTKEGIGLLFSGGVRGGGYASLVTPLRRILEHMDADLAT